jgi:hypothetical protein
LAARPFERRSSGNRDLFEALADLRQSLEEQGIRLFCNGARTDVWPSGMSRSMSGGRKAYVLRLGTHARDLVDIFDGAEPSLIPGGIASSSGCTMIKVDLDSPPCAYPAVYCWAAS